MFHVIVTKLLLIVEAKTEEIEGGVESSVAVVVSDTMFERPDSLGASSDVFRAK